MRADRLALASGLVLLATAALLASCAATRQPRGEVKPSGFLHDYSMLEAGGEGRARLRYVDTRVDFSRYQAVLVDSVALWSGPGLAKLSAEEKRALVDHAYTALLTALARSFRVATVPARDTLRIRAAITEATGSAVAPDVVATVIPQVRLIGSLSGLAADSALTVGEASGEVEITDALTDQVVAAAVDRRVGQRSMSGMLSKWSDVEEAWNHWAEQLRKGLVEACAGHAPAAKP